MKKPLLIGIFASFASLSFAQGPENYFLSDDGCASGGNTQYFFFDGIYIDVCHACDNQPSVSLGTWKESGGKVTINIKTVYEGIGENLIPTGANNNVYESYKASKTQVNTTKSFEWYVPNEDDGCETGGEIGEEVPDVRSFLRNNTVERKYDFASYDLLSESDLMSYSKDELRIMRNEIFASYGYAFKTADMQKRFPGGNMSDVTAFLSETETKNIDLIKKVEAKK